MLLFNKKILVFLIGFVSFSQLDAVTLRITCRAKGVELELLREYIDEWIKLTGNQHKVEIITLPHASNECYALYQQWFSAGSFDVDIIQMDIVFVGAFSDHLASLDEYITDKEISAEDIFDGIKSCMYNKGHLVALPIYTDVEVMFYRVDLLKKYGRPEPKTWQELYETARYIQNEERKDLAKKSRFFGMVFQAKAFEMLTCNFVGVSDSFGGSIFKGNKLVVNSNENIAAILFLIDCMKNISSRSVLNYSEEDCRGMFQSGNAVFMPNWPYVWALANDSSCEVAGKIDVMPLPPSANGGKSSGVIGGWFFAVSKYSKHTRFAADLVKYLTSRKLHRLRAKFGYAPAYKSLYSDDFVLRYNPYFRRLSLALENAVARPSGAFGKGYQRASTEIFNTINMILSESVESDFSSKDVRKFMNRLQRKLKHLLQAQARKSANRGGAYRKLWKSVRDFFNQLFFLES